MSDDKTEDKLIATTRMSKSAPAKTTKKKVATKKAAATKKTVAKPASKPAASKPDNQLAEVQSSAAVAGPESSHGDAFSSSRRVWPD